MKAKKKRMTVAQQEAKEERDGQGTLWADVHREHRGGYRENAGRKPGKKPPLPVHSVRCSAVEWKKVKKLLAEMRKENKLGI